MGGKVVSYVIEKSYAMLYDNHRRQKGWLFTYLTRQCRRFERRRRRQPQNIPELLLKSFETFLVY